MFNRRSILLSIFIWFSTLEAYANNFTDLRDQSFKIQSPAVINFWATWCAPCIKELPDLEILGQKLSKDATVYLVNFGENTKTIEAFKNKKPELFGNNTVLLKDAKMSGLKSYGLRGVPTTILINTSGKAIETIQGMKDWGATNIIDEIREKILH
ncbi:MAG: hypothetical protein CMD99_09460 [Gammaproteobacteria bacterium]|nr:hypothetical protein [Gammaproteobacteria bacterium]